MNLKAAFHNLCGCREHVGWVFQGRLVLFFNQQGMRSDENGQVLFAKNYSKPNWMTKFLFFDILNYFGLLKFEDIFKYLYLLFAINKNIIIILQYIKIRSAIWCRNKNNATKTILLRHDFTCGSVSGPILLWNENIQECN